MNTSTLYIIFGSIIILSMIISFIIFNKTIKPINIKKDYLKRVLTNVAIQEINDRINNMTEEEIEQEFNKLKNTENKGDMVND